MASSTQLLLDECSVRFARRDRGGGGRSRWPGWRNLHRRAGGHPGGICPLGDEALLVRTDRLTVDPRSPFDLSLASPALQQRAQGRLQMRFQGVHSNSPSREGGESNALPGTCRESSARHDAAFRWRNLGGQKRGSLGGRRRMPATWKRRHLSPSIATRHQERLIPAWCSAQRGKPAATTFRASA
jgi:hypothetical protein